MFTAALFTTAKMWKHTRCPSMDECTRKIDTLCADNGILLSLEKEGNSNTHCSVDEP